jgi:hypothetical protein
MLAEKYHLTRKSPDAEHDVLRVNGPRWGSFGTATCKCGWFYDGASSIGAAYNRLVAHIEGSI